MYNSSNVMGNSARNGKSKLAAAFMALFLGGFGIHKFYLGRVFAGMIYLLFFWTFIPAFLAFIDFIILITMSDTRFDEKYGDS